MKNANRSVPTAFLLSFTYVLLCQFQRRNYAKLMYLRCGKKGYGLQLQEDVPAGRFLIEYVGEVKLCSLFLVH
jgi:hypothetical protein